MPQPSMKAGAWSLAALLLFALPAFAQPSLVANLWRFQHSPGMPAHPTPLKPVGWSFAFPPYAAQLLPCAHTQACASVHYLTVPTRTLNGYRQIVMSGRIIITGNPRFQYETEPSNTPARGCNTPASVRLYFQRRGDTLTGLGPYEHYRWWSNPRSLELDGGVFRLVVPLIPSEWSSVFGDKGDVSPIAMAGFRAARANVDNVGMTFGGGCFFGHGVNVSGGTARFVVTQFVVN